MSAKALITSACAAAAVIALGQTDVIAFRGTESRAPLANPTSADAAFAPAGAIGPDVIVGSLPAATRWATSATEVAYSIATTSCNIGDANLLWQQQPSILHPVIGQNLYRLSADGRFEQIGQAWLKHAFCALQLDLAGCGSCPNDPGCLSYLEPGCSDPYTADRNGQQSNLGPKWQVNAHTGVFSVPWAQGEGTAGSFRRRLRANVVDLDPAQNPGALYFIEGQYVTQDDATSGNQNNNASYRRVTVGASPYNLSVTGSTQMMNAGIEAWSDFDASVVIVSAQVSGDGLFKVGYKVTDNGDGTWDYEYAVYNMNADRAAQSFSIPVGGAGISAIGFHDVPYHSGDGIGDVNFDGTDWAPSIAAGALTWMTDAFADNASANALRWGTLYNFRFTASAPPVAANATIGLFKPGTPPSVTAPVLVPDPTTAGACCLDSGACDGAGDAGDCLALGGTYQGDGTTCGGTSCPQPGACCFGDGSCTFVFAADCGAAGGAYQGSQVTCGAADCPQPGACCLGSGACTFVFEADCSASGGAYQGSRVTCEAAACPQPGACCLGNGACTFVFQSACSAAGGSYQGDRVACESAGCPQPGACCFADGSCTFVFAADCGSAGGAYQGDQVACAGACPQPGACCFGDGSCTFVFAADCSSAGGAYQGAQVACAGACPQPGACCFGDGSCTFVFEADCGTAGGAYQGAQVACAGAGCPQPGACCFADGSCTFGAPSECAGSGGAFQGEGVACIDAGCPQPGACCLADGACTFLLEADCGAAGGAYQGPVACIDVECPQPGACCFADGACTAGFETDCSAAGGVYEGDHVACAGACPQPGACCLDDGACRQEAAIGGAACADDGGAYQGDGTECESADCPQPCPADITGPAGVPDGEVSFFDLLVILSTWGPCAGCPGDITGPAGVPDGEVGFFDLLVILSTWGPCP